LDTGAARPGPDALSNDPLYLGPSGASHPVADEVYSRGAPSACTPSPRPRGAKRRASSAPFSPAAVCAWHPIRSEATGSRASSACPWPPPETGIARDQEGRGRFRSYGSGGLVFPRETRPCRPGFLSASRHEAASRTVASDGEAHDGRREDCYEITPALQRLNARPCTPTITSSPVAGSGTSDTLRRCCCGVPATCQPLCAFSRTSDRCSPAPQKAGRSRPRCRPLAG
jgi:hypothetical protein